MVHGNQIGLGFRMVHGNQIGNNRNANAIQEILGFCQCLHWAPAAHNLLIREFGKPSKLKCELRVASGAAAKFCVGCFLSSFLLLVQSPPCPRSPSKSRRRSTRRNRRATGRKLTRKKVGRGKLYSSRPRGGFRQHGMRCLGKFDKPPNKGIELQRYKDNKVGPGPAMHAAMHLPCMASPDCPADCCLHAPTCMTWSHTHRQPRSYYPLPDNLDPRPPRPLQELSRGINACTPLTPTACTWCPAPADCPTPATALPALQELSRGINANNESNFAAIAQSKGGRLKTVSPPPCPLSCPLRVPPGFRRVLNRSSG